jgi:aryl-alcohol dehydrogenase-like predicted oxidoreductase
MLATKEDGMRYRLLGRSGLRVSELGLGTMTFGTDWGWGADLTECSRIVETFAAAGGNLIDTASNYTDGSSERIVGELTEADRDRWVIATKYTLTLDRADPNAGGNHRKSLVRALERSLRSLRTDHVDVLWMHMRDATTPIEEVVRALDDQVRLGKVLYVGISDSPAWVAARANAIAELRGWTPFVGLQLPYSLASRDPERELLPMAAELGLTVTPWGVLGAGLLTGRSPQTLRWPEEPNERTGAVADALAAVAEDAGCTPAQAAIAWLLRRSGPEIVPIVGVRSAGQLEENLGALDVELTADHRAQLDAIAPPALGFPRSFLESSGVRELIYGDTWDLLYSNGARAGDEAVAR